MQPYVLESTRLGIGIMALFAVQGLFMLLSPGSLRFQKLTFPGRVSILTGKIA